MYLPLSSLRTNATIICLYEYISFTVCKKLSFCPVFLTLMSRVTPQEKRGSVFGWGASAKVSGSLFSSLLGGFIIYHFGVRWIFYTDGIFMLLLIPVLCLLPRMLRNSR